MDWDLFGGVPEHEIRSRAVRRRFRRGEVVFHRGDPGEAVHLVDRGHFAARVITPLGDAATLAIYKPGDCFGMLALLDEARTRTATVEALEAGETLALARADFDALRRGDASIERALDRYLATTIAALDRRLLEAYYLPVAVRVRRSLEDLADVYAPAVDGWVTIPLGQDHIAGVAGTTRESANRILRSEQAAGRVRLGRNRVLVSRP